MTGTALVQASDSEKLVTESESIFIPVGGAHSLENPAKCRWNGLRCKPRLTLVKTTLFGLKTGMAVLEHRGKT